MVLASRRADPILPDGRRVQAGDRGRSGIDAVRGHGRAGGPAEAATESLAGILPSGRRREDRDVEAVRVGVLDPRVLRGHLEQADGQDLRPRDPDAFEQRWDTARLHVPAARHQHGGTRQRLSPENGLGEACIPRPLHR
jgi:hypothetical protein